MRNSLKPVLVIATALTACADGPASPELHERPQYAGAGRSALPIHGSCDLTSATVISFQPPMLQQSSTGECEVSHLGRASLRTFQTINVATGAQTAASTYTTRSGDQLFVTSSGTGTPTGPTTLDFAGVTTITGGTGRFAGASGQMSAHGAVDNATGLGWLKVEGWISYAAESRAAR